jgi:DNA-binding winged helix-turn-helix (wHTH) protein/tetratricopeptide (TPR) repeat protein
MIAQLLDGSRVQVEDEETERSAMSGDQRSGNQRSGQTSIRFGAYELRVSREVRAFERLGAREDLWPEELRRDGRRVRLAPQALRILTELTATPGALVTREHLRRVLWPDGIHVDFDRSLNTAVRKLRRALHDEAEHPRYVETIVGRGYRFIAAVEADIAVETISAEAASTDEGADIARVPDAVVAATPTAPRPLVGMGFAALLLVSTLSLAWALAHHGQPAAALAARGDRAAAHLIDSQHLSIEITSLEETVRRDPGAATAWATLARVRATRAWLDGRDAPELVRAQSEAQRALAVDSGLVDAQMAMGLVRYTRDRDAIAAEAWFRRAMARSSERSTASNRLWLAVALNAQGRHADALDVVDEGIAEAPDAAVLHAWRGLLLHALHRYDEELAALTRATTIDAQSAEAWFHLGLGYARRGDYARALPLMQRAAHLSGEGGYYVSWLGRVAADAGDLTAAERALAQLDAMEHARGLNPALRSSVVAHIESRRIRASRPLL